MSVELARQESWGTGFDFKGITIPDHDFDFDFDFDTGQFQQHMQEMERQLERLGDMKFDLDFDFPGFRHMGGFGFHSRRPVLDGQLDELRALDELDVDTPLERRATVIADLDGTRLHFEGKWLRFPDRLRAELEFLIEADGPFTAADLPGTLDDAGRLVLVRRLVRAGFLRRSAAGA